MPLHPAVVHIPIALAALMPLITLGLLLAWWRGWLPRRVWWLAVALQAALVGSGSLALRTGHGDSERAEQVRGEAAVDAHEDAAEVFEWSAAGMLGIALAAALLRREGAARVTAGVAAAASLAVLALGYRTGSAGGHLVYGGSAGAALSAGGGEASGGAVSTSEDDDGDD